MEKTKRTVNGIKDANDKSHGSTVVLSLLREGEYSLSVEAKCKQAILVGQITVTPKGTPQNILPPTNKLMLTPRLRISGGIFEMQQTFVNVLSTEMKPFPRLFSPYRKEISNPRT
jgi:hypothetical protein